MQHHAGGFKEMPWPKEEWRGEQWCAAMVQSSSVAMPVQLQKQWCHRAVSRQLRRKQMVSMPV